MIRNLAVLLLVASSLLAQDKKKEEERKPGAYDDKAFAGLTFRSIGPSVTSGLIGDIAVDPRTK